MELGLQRAGFRCIGSCDNDKAKREIYRKNFGAYPTHGDIRELDGSEIGKPTVLAAGFPCPTFSIAGKRLGFKDPRGEIFFEIARIANKARPRILLLENVVGLLSHDDGWTFAKILSTLDEIGYDAEWWCIDGRHFVPQSRERVFIVGHLRERPTAKVFPFSDSEAASAKGDGKTLTSQDIHGVAIPIRDVKFNKGTAKGRRAKTNGEPSFTVKSFATAGIYDGMEMRIFTPLECERLMGFPDGWTDGLGLTDRPRYKAMGDAVIPAVVERIGRELMKTLQSQIS